MDEAIRANLHKLRTRLDNVKRKRALWRLFRIGGKVAGVLCVKLARAAERVYAPGAAGYKEAQENFEATLQLLWGGDGGGEARGGGVEGEHARGDGSVNGAE